MDYECFKVLYTKHKTQKSKKWQDGTAKINKRNGKVYLFYYSA